MTGERDRQLLRDFELFDAKNPLVWALFDKYATQMYRARLAAGDKKPRYGSRAIMERIRWDLNIRTVRSSDFKINNNYTRRYAQKWIQHHPLAEGFFEFRDGNVCWGSADVKPQLPVPVKPGEYAEAGGIR